MVHTCRSLPGEGHAHAAGVLSHHFDVIRGSRQQVVQSGRGHITHKEINGLVFACEYTEK